MASLVSVTENADVTNGTVYTTASFAIDAGKSYILVVAASNATDPGAPTITGQGQGEWTFVSSVTVAGAVTSRLYVYHLDRRSEEGSSSAATLTITWAATAARCIWSILRVDDGDPTGAIQAVSGSGTGTSATVNLAALRNANSLCVGIFEHHANETHTEGTDFTQITDRASGEALGLLVESKNNDTSVDASWTTSAAYGAIALEIANQRSMTSTSTWTFGVASILQKLKSLVSASTWTLGIATVLSRINLLLVYPASPDSQTLTAASPSTETLSAASPDSQTLTPTSPDTLGQP